jgi:hypothetical protein
MIWKIVAQGRFYSAAAGAERTYNLEIQDWGLQVKDVLVALVVTGRGSTNAKVHLRFDDGATDNVNEFISPAPPTTYNDLIGTSAVMTPVSGTLPDTIKGALSGAFIGIMARMPSCLARISTTIETRSP